MQQDALQWNLIITRSLGPWKLPCYYQVSHQSKKQRNIKTWDQQNYLLIREFCYIRPFNNEVPLYWYSYLVLLQLYPGPAWSCWWVVQWSWRWCYSCPRGSIDSALSAGRDTWEGQRSACGSWCGCTGPAGACRPWRGCSGWSQSKERMKSNKLIFFLC